MTKEEMKATEKRAENLGYVCSKNKGTFILWESNDIIITETNKINFFKQVEKFINGIEENIN